MRRIHYFDEEWEVSRSGNISVAAGSKRSRWPVVFRNLSNPDIPEVEGTIPEPNPEDIEDDDLIRELVRARVARAIEFSKFTWRTVAGISSDTTVPASEVQGTLEQRPDEFIRAARPDKHGRVLYSTRKHYKSSTSFFERYLDVLDSSST